MVEKLVTFEVDGEEYGIDITAVESIERMQYVTRVPGAHLTGVTNIRGRLWSVVDFRTLMNLAKKEHNEATRMLLINEDRYQVAFIVDQANSVLDVASVEMSENPAAYNSKRLTYIEGVYHTDDRLITVLQVKELLEKVGGVVK
ncbi:chemotaxis protein CheW [Shouchella shacheensis]|uniref:chemotaxis protein CheW n=1 Tax=Shouchella shacheensis TaxID=1649580 RepID=UPI00073FEB13|nr:chemotaxis protein CheW [Shouchella shacheensis]